ncbi:MAG: hypothetical protein ACJAYB_000953 [Psychromonas sp.]|jgi:hypothetical protein
MKLFKPVMSTVTSPEYFQNGFNENIDALDTQFAKNILAESLINQKIRLKANGLCLFKLIFISNLSAPLIKTGYPLESFV